MCVNCRAVNNLIDLVHRADGRLGVYLGFIVAVAVSLRVPRSPCGAANTRPSHDDKV